MEIIDFDWIGKAYPGWHAYKGSKPKCLYSGKWYKPDFNGYEAISEVLISELLDKSNVEDYVSYELGKFLYEKQWQGGSISKNFRKSEEQIISIERLHSVIKGVSLSQSIYNIPSVSDRIKYLVEFVESTTGIEGYGEYLTKLMELDEIFLNEGRKLTSLCVIKNEKKNTYRPAPVFGFGSALLSNVEEFPPTKDILKSIASTRSSLFDSNFTVQAKAAEKIYGQQLRLSFIIDDVNESLQSMSEIYSKETLNRVEQIMQAQINNHPELF